MDSHREFDVERIGGLGDGVGEVDGKPCFVAYALPGERWRQAEDGSFERLSDAAERAIPSCQHFGECGGCVAQHMQAELYQTWKANLVREALARQNIDTALKPIWQAEAGSRRRLALSVNARGGGIGFRAARSHDLVEISECEIARPEIVALLPTLLELLSVISKVSAIAEDVRVHVLAACNGLDVWIDKADQELSATTRQRLAAIAQDGRMLRLVIGRDEIYQAGQPIIRVTDVEIKVPVGAFVQAVAAAEAKIARLALRAIGRSKHVADLFCGLGAFTLPIARKARVFAADSDQPAIEALEDAVRHGQRLKPVKTLRRDLFREPLSRGELNAFDAVVFDPPRAGAEAQAQALAKSKVPLVVAVSCNPTTLARDLRILLDGGYALESVTPIDQFLYSAHVEAVAVLRR